MEAKERENLALRQLVDYLAEHSQRLTKARKSVVQTIYRMEDLISIEDILKRHKKLFPEIHICRATVYNNVQTLIEANIIQEIRHFHYTVYKKACGGGNQTETVCNICHKNIQTKIDHLECLVDKIKVPDFQFSNYRIVLYGVCAECQMKCKNTIRNHQYKSPKWKKEK